MRSIFVDMDGVVADFDAHYQRHFGVRLNRWPGPDKTDWGKVASVPDFFRTIPKMADADWLLNGIRPRPFTMLTGIPKSIDRVDNDKVWWIGENVKPAPEGIICCPAREKYLHGKPGDVLIDDYTKYADLWIAMGGIFIVHHSAAESLDMLYSLGY